jgi:LysM repeat protein
MRRALWLLLAFALLASSATPALAGAPAAPAAAVPAPQGANLLQNPGFESPYGKQCCQTDLGTYLPGTPIDEVQVAWGWAGWWLQPDLDPAHPGDCRNATGPCIAWHRPEWREAACGAVCANRVRSGDNAQKYFTFYSVHDAGMLQQVSGVRAGQRLRFSAYMQGWSTHENYGASSGQGGMGMRVGIDPTGGTNPFSSRVVWSAAFDTYDTWGLYSVEAVAQGGTVTVFTRSAPAWPLQHNDIYVDDASLVVVGTGAAAPAATQPPAQATAVPGSAPTPVAGFIYVVQPGDNYYRIAAKFGVTVQALFAANNVTNPNILYAGSRLIIPGVPPAGTAAPAPTAVPAATLAPEQIPGAITYVVQRGDNLYRLSLRFNTSIARIKQLNNLVSDIIYIGQVLIIAP